MKTRPSFCRNETIPRFVAVIFLLACLNGLLPAAVDPAGYWEGAIELPGVELEIRVDLEKTDGQWTGSISIPVQGLRGFALGAIAMEDDAVSFKMPAIAGDHLKAEVSGDQLHLELDSIRAVYDGALSDDGSEIRGEWSQGGQGLPLVFKRLVREPDLRRPQEPEEPYPYQVEEVSFPGGAEDVRLAGTLTLPEGTPPYPAVVLLSGSGPQDRDGTIMGHRPFLVLAGH
ncbi:MAG TPA: hypothetical protein VMN36_08370 [Verrucomicrobiales bacterium]|nr:hypothetical protein [Verrucomicrobiales bacterium]